MHFLLQELELVLNMLAEATTTEISKQKDPTTFSENMQVAKSGGEAAGEARKAVEARTGVPVISPKAAVDFTKLIEIVGEVGEDKDGDGK